MKKILIGLGLVLAMSTQAQAYWECKATSFDGWGLGISNSRISAEHIALSECASGTHPANICVINYCVIR